MSLVLDASVALAWVHPDEPSGQLDAIMDGVREAGAFVPAIWPWEVSNVLTLSVRRGRILARDRADILNLLSALGIRIEEMPNIEDWMATLDMADRHRLTVYDAAYLELAKRRQLPLATLDRALAEAARVEGVALLL